MDSNSDIFCGSAATHLRGVPWETPAPGNLIPKDPDGFLTVEQMFFQVRGVEKCDMPCYDVQHHPTRSNVQQSQRLRTARQQTMPINKNPWIQGYKAPKHSPKICFWTEAKLLMPRFGQEVASIHIGRIVKLCKTCIWFIYVPAMDNKYVPLQDPRPIWLFIQLIWFN